MGPATRLLRWTGEDLLISVVIPMKKPEKLRPGPLILVLIISLVVGAIAIRVNSQIYMRELGNLVEHLYP